MLIIITQNKIFNQLIVKFIARTGLVISKG